MATVTKTSDGMDVNINASKFNHVYATFRGKTAEITNFQNGQALTGQRTNASGNMVEDYEGNVNHYESASKSGQVTLNILEDSDWDDALGFIYHEQHDNMTPENAKDSFLDITYINDLTKKYMVAEKCRITNLPNADMNTSVQNMPWILNASKYDILYQKPDLPFLE